MSVIASLPIRQKQIRYVTEEERISLDYSFVLEMEELETTLLRQGCFFIYA
jgi:hypothetical protein